MIEEKHEDELNNNKKFKLKVIPDIKVYIKIFNK